jgi:hypothetical protein
MLRRMVSDPVASESSCGGGGGEAAISSALLTLSTSSGEVDTAATAAPCPRAATP